MKPILYGIATGTALAVLAAIFTLTTAPVKSEARINVYKSKMQDLAFCQKGYEIASSFPHYSSRTASFKTKKMLLLQADRLEAKSKFLTNILDNELKEEALALGIGSVDYDILLADTKAKAEFAAVLSVQSVDSQSVFVNRLDEVCAPYLN